MLLFFLSVAPSPCKNFSGCFLSHCPCISLALSWVVLACLACWRECLGQSCCKGAVSGEDCNMWWRGEVLCLHGTVPHHTPGCCPRVVYVTTTWLATVPWSVAVGGGC